jgi:hypothetical protein|tara:strand:- start:2663 stop:2857 length:195 start_codon:yes stop_codon:yes gene_type:complete
MARGKGFYTRYCEGETITDIAAQLMRRHGEMHADKYASDRYDDCRTGEEKDFWRRVQDKLAPHF